VFICSSAVVPAYCSPNNYRTIWQSSYLDTITIPRDVWLWNSVSITHQYRRIPIVNQHKSLWDMNSRQLYSHTTCSICTMTKVTSQSHAVQITQLELLEHRSIGYEVPIIHQHRSLWDMNSAPIAFTYLDTSADSASMFNKFKHFNSVIWTACNCEVDE